jgi:hypothetical protein
MQLTPLRVRKIVAFLKHRIGSDVISIYGGGATDGQPGRPPAHVSEAVLLLAPEHWWPIRIACGAPLPLISGQTNVLGSRAGSLPFRCSGRALRDEIGGILERDFVPGAGAISTARR